jgi:hypothetical protein
LGENFLNIILIEYFIGAAWIQFRNYLFRNQLRIQQQVSNTTGTGYDFGSGSTTVITFFPFPRQEEDEMFDIPESFDADLDNQQYSSPER